MNEDLFRYACSVVHFISLFISKKYGWFDYKNISNDYDHTEENRKKCEWSFEHNSVQKDAENRRHEADDNEIPHWHEWNCSQEGEANGGDKEPIGS